jgi:hypothetical protein
MPHPAANLRDRIIAGLVGLAFAVAGNVMLVQDARKLLDPAFAPPFGRLVILIPLLFLLLGLYLLYAAAKGTVGESALLAKRHQDARRSGVHSGYPGDTPAPVMFVLWNVFILISAAVLSLPGTKIHTNLPFFSAFKWYLIAMIGADIYLALATLRWFRRRRNSPTP